VKSACFLDCHFSQFCGDRRGATLKYVPRKDSLPDSTSELRIRTYGRRVAGALTILSILSFLAGCDGFFVDPVLTGMAVGPSAAIQTGNTVQMSAVGTYNDGSQKNLDSGVFWSSDPPTVAVVNASGLVRGIAPGKAIITGAHGTTSGSATITVTLGGLTSIQVTTIDGLSSITYGTTEQFVATGSANGQQIDITDSVTWSTNPRSIANVSIASNTGLMTTTSGPVTTDQFIVVALDPATGLAGQMNFAVHP
jgi:Bacterial Ig-like domain (group 2)